MSQRLKSLDALRGFNLFFLVALGPVLLNFCNGVPNGCGDWFFNPLSHLLTHEEWEGLTPWDLIMPLFMFISAASIPFSMARYRRERDYKAFALRLLRRVVVLWLLGIVIQGNLRSLDFDHIYLFTNTLQSIAVAYAVAAVLFVFSRPRTQVAAFVVLLLAYWALMEFVSVDGFGGGQYGPTDNLAEWVDRTVLGRFRDGASLQPDGTVYFAPWYTNTWILSSLTFAATGVAGLLAGTVCRNASTLTLRLKKRDWRLSTQGILLLTGAAMVLVAWLWSAEMPVVKRIWTSSMCLLAAGWSFLLMGVFYWWYDAKGKTTGLEFLRTYGMNSIVAYTLEEMVNFRSIPHSLFYGLEQYIGDFYPFVLVLGQAVIIYLILLAMKRLGIFLKV